MALPSSLSDADLEVLLADLPHRQIPTYDELSFSTFLNTHLIPNTPFVLSSKVTASWPSRQSWAIRSDRNGESSRPNLAALRKYGDQVVPVADTTRRAYSEFERTERKLSEVLDLWDGQTDGGGDGKGLYVKDWHLLAEVEKAGGNSREIYEVPECFREDWLNPSFENTSNQKTAARSPSQSDFRFTYLGPRGTFTPIHRDVYASYSWSANIVGRKLWWLFPPDPTVLGNLGISTQGHQGERAGGAVFDVRELNEVEGCIKVVQDEGEIIFVPSGWYHQVLNLDFCISINHNFIAPATLSRVYNALDIAQKAVEEGIADVKVMIQSRLGTASEHGSAIPAWEVEWVNEVQSLLEMDAGWGWKGFWECTRDNIMNPPAKSEHSTPIKQRKEYILEAVARYTRRREWETLPDVRIIIQQIEHLMQGS